MPSECAEKVRVARARGEDCRGVREADDDDGRYTKTKLAAASWRRLRGAVTRPVAKVRC
jgi:hypothetical protein